MKSPAEADYRARALEVAIHLAVIAFIVLGAFWMFSPFVMVVLWAIWRARSGKLSLPSSLPGSS